MARNRAACGIDNRSVIDRLLASGLKFVYLPLHGVGSAADKTAIYSNVEGMPTEATVAGTTTNLWAKPGRITFSGDNYIELMKGDLRRLDWLAPANQQHIVVGYQFFEQANPTGASEIHWSDTLASPRGGFGARRQASDIPLSMRWRPESGTDANASFKDIVSSVPVQGFETAATVQHFNCRDVATSNLYINGVLRDSDALPGNLPLLNESHALTIGAQSSNNTPTLLCNQYGTGTTMSDFFIFVSKDDIAAEIAALALQQHYYRNRLPAMLLDFA